jgi:xylulokinase
VLLGIDLGTSSVKAAVMEEDGSVKQVESAGYRVESLAPGWAETSPDAWWEATRKAVSSLDRRYRRRLTAIGLAGQMHGLVLAREDGQAVRPAILWADGRSERELDRYRRLSPRLRRVLANPPATGMAGPTLLWIKRNESSRYRDARWALQPKDWLRLKLTSEACSEPTDASATLLYDFVQDGWSQEILGELGIRSNLLPPLVASHQLVGHLRDGAALDLGLESGLPVAAGAADTAASLVGHGLLKPGKVLLAIGTGAQLTSVRTQFRPDPTLRTHLYRTVEEGKWYSMAAILNAGLALDWVRDLFQLDWDALYRSAIQAPPGAGGVTFLPYLVGERAPRSDSRAGACWSGVRLHHGMEHLLRAALEGVAFAVRGTMERLEAAGISASELHLAGGGTTDQAWRQLLADVLGKRLVAAPSPAGAARGAALIAGWSAGVYRGADELAALAPGYELVGEPGPPAEEYTSLYEKYGRARRAPRGASREGRQRA